MPQTPRFSSTTATLLHSVTAICSKVSDIPIAEPALKVLPKNEDPHIFRREEMKIQAWENHEKAKTEAKMQKIEQTYGLGIVYVMLNDRFAIVYPATYHVVRLGMMQLDLDDELEEEEEQEEVFDDED
ncbi:hypothetical protein RIF29_33678 [Crotalaria pallida]|uniref:Remorin C-terminal domain-containing protein n=1 Tax=Crotalaria pallida TaxID=3830 RepID=A0AAN9EAA6_CROPI